MQKLSNAGKGNYTVKWIFTEPGLRKLLSDIRIEVGKEITVLSNNRRNGVLLKSEAGSFFIEADALWGVTV